MNRTVLDPSRSERLADQVFENEELREALADRLAAGLGAAIPGEVEVPEELLLQAANLALDDPRVQALVRTGIVETHRNALEGNTEPVTIDASALGASVRDSLITLSPSLAAVVPEVPPVEVTLPTGGLSFLGKIRSFVQKATTIGAALALVGAVSALILTTNRPAVLRRVAFWAFGAAAFWLAVGFGVPWAAARIAPSSGAIVAAVIDVFFGSMIPPAITLAVVGAGLLGASFLWSTASAYDSGPRDDRRDGHRDSYRDDRRGPSDPQGRAARSGPSVSSNIRQPRDDYSGATGQQQEFQQGFQQGYEQAVRHTGQVPQQPAYNPHGQQPGMNPTGANPVVDPTLVQPPAGTTPDPWAITNPGPNEPELPKPRWVEGQGYVYPEAPGDR